MKHYLILALSFFFIVEGRLAWPMIQPEGRVKDLTGEGGSLLTEGRLVWPMIQPEGKVKDLTGEGGSLLTEGRLAWPMIQPEGRVDNLTGEEGSSRGCGGNFVTVGDQCLKFETFAALDQVEARQMCHSQDAQLATIRTATQLYNIIHYITDNGVGGSNYWLDGSDQASEGDWIDSSGEPIVMGTPFWEAHIGGHQPDNADGEQHCQMINAGYFYYMDDSECSGQFRPLCEIRQLSNSNISASVGDVDCPAYFVDVGGQCLSFMTWADLTWVEARQDCHGLQGELATITDIQLLRDIYLYLHKEGIADHSFWLGGSDAGAEGVWTWTDGSSVPAGAPFWGYTGSGSLEPDGGDTENCLMIDADGSYYFRDAQCDQVMNPLCQFKFQEVERINISHTSAFAGNFR